MYTDVDEVVEVIVVFKKNKAVPAVLRWGNKDYKIEKVNMVHQIWEGETLLHSFAVSDGSNFFKLLFNTKNLQWKLEQVYSEG
jgi:hypothetical protein